MSNPSGPELAREIVAYRNRIGVSEADFARASGISAQTICSIRHAAYPKPSTIARVRDFIAAHHDALPPEHAAVVPNRRGPALVKRSGREGLESARSVSVAPARPSISEAAANEADDAARRRSAARAGSPRGAVPHVLLANASPAETLATALVETPGDLIGRVRAAWPDLWAGVVMASRDSGVPAGAMLMRVISRGLEEISA